MDTDSLKGIITSINDTLNAISFKSIGETLTSVMNITNIVPNVKVYIYIIIIRILLMN